MSLILRIVLIHVIILSALHALAPQQEFLDPKDVRKKTKVKKFETIMYSEDKIFLDTKNRKREFIETSGFRVQLASSQNIKDVLPVKEKADELFNLPVYIEFESPNYKVRIGNFLSNDNATNMQETMRKKGFSNAWVVPSNIVIEKKR